MDSSNVIALSDFRQSPAPVWSRPGYIENSLSTWRETAAWKALAAEHESARCKGNDLVEAGVGLGCEKFAQAADEYREACRDVLAYKKPKPRHLPTMNR